MEVKEEEQFSKFLNYKSLDDLIKYISPLKNVDEMKYFFEKFLAYIIETQPDLQSTIFNTIASNPTEENFLKFFLELFYAMELYEGFISFEVFLYITVDLKLIFDFRKCELYYNLIKVYYDVMNQKKILLEQFFNLKDYQNNMVSSNTNIRSGNSLLKLLDNKANNKNVQVCTQLPYEKLLSMNSYSDICKCLLELDDEFSIKSYFNKLNQLNEIDKTKIKISKIYEIFLVKRDINRFEKILVKNFIPELLICLDSENISNGNLLIKIIKSCFNSYKFTMPKIKFKRFETKFQNVKNPIVQSILLEKYNIVIMNNIKNDSSSLNDEKLSEADYERFTSCKQLNKYLIDCKEISKIKSFFNIFMNNLRNNYNNLEFSCNFGSLFKCSQKYTNKNEYDNFVLCHRILGPLLKEVSKIKDENDIELMKYIKSDLKKDLVDFKLFTCTANKLEKRICRSFTNEEKKTFFSYLNYNYKIDEKEKFERLKIKEESKSHDTTFVNSNKEKIYNLGKKYITIKSFNDLTDLLIKESIEGVKLFFEIILISLIIRSQSHKVVLEKSSPYNFFTNRSKKSDAPILEFFLQILFKLESVEMSEDLSNYLKFSLTVIYQFPKTLKFLNKIIKMRGKIKKHKDLYEVIFKNYVIMEIPERTNLIIHPNYLNTVSKYNKVIDAVKSLNSEHFLKIVQDFIDDDFPYFDPNNKVIEIKEVITEIQETKEIRKIINFYNTKSKNVQLNLANLLLEKFYLLENDLSIMVDYFEQNEIDGIREIIISLAENKYLFEALQVLSYFKFDKNIKLDKILILEMAKIFENQGNIYSINKDPYSNLNQELVEEYFYDENNNCNLYTEDESNYTVKNKDKPGKRRKQNLIEENFDIDKYYKIFSEKELEIKFLDEFSPYDENCFKLPTDVQIFIIDTLEKLLDLKNQQFDEILGIDSEWHPDLIKSNNNQASIIQVGGKSSIYIFDIINLQNYPYVEIFIQIFKSCKFVCFDFEEDFKKIDKEICEFLKPKLMDLKEEKIKLKYIQSNGLSCLFVSLFNQKLCKFSQCSNWNYRPLRKPQIHYAATDAYILPLIYTKLNETIEIANLKRESKYLQILDEEKYEDIYNKIPEYAGRLLELLEFEKMHEENSSIETIKQMTIEQLKENEILVDKLKFVEVKKSYFCDKYLYIFEKNKYIYTEIDKGDSVGIYKYNLDNPNSENEDQVLINSLEVNEKDLLSENPIYIAEVYSLNSKYITLLYDNKDMILPEDNSFCFVQLTNFSAYTTIKRILNGIKNCEILNYSGDLFRVLLNLSDPTSFSKQIDFNVPTENLLNLPSIHNKQIEFFNKNINSSQKDAINNCLDNLELGLIHGPPGTGKTYTLVELILQNLKLKNKVLVCAFNNIAVDNIAEMLLTSSFSDSSFSPRFCRIGRLTKMLENVKEICMDTYISKGPYSNNSEKIHYLISQLKTAANLTIKKRIKSKIWSLKNEIEFYKKYIIHTSDVVLCTNVGAGCESLYDYIDNYKNYFDLVIIDEAAQAPEYSCWIPILYGRKLVMAGDHMQLRPTIKSEEAKKELSYTLFEKMVDYYSENSNIRSLLKVQYRMNKNIMGFSSKEFYENKLTASPSVENRVLKEIAYRPYNDYLKLLDKSLIDIDSSQYGYNETKNSKNSFFNLGEVEIVNEIVQYLLNCGVDPNDIGVITPYKGQVRHIKHKFSYNNKNVIVSSVDAFQGREKEVIIISMVRNNVQGIIGFVKDERRLNVSITRAKRMLIFIWNKTNFTDYPLFLRLQNYFIQNSYYLKLEDLLTKSVKIENNYKDKKFVNYNQSNNDNYNNKGHTHNSTEKNYIPSNINAKNNNKKGKNKNKY